MSAPDTRFQELCVRTSELFPAMPLREVFSMVTFNLSKDEFQPDNEQYIRNLVMAHVRHKFTDYDKFIGMREKYMQAGDMPVGLRDAAWNLDRLVKQGELHQDSVRAVWGMVVRAWYVEQSNDVLTLWSCGS